MRKVRQVTTHIGNLQRLLAQADRGEIRITVTVKRPKPQKPWKNTFFIYFQLNLKVFLTAFR